jgi:hypothetical protein
MKKMLLTILILFFCINDSKSQVIYFKPLPNYNYNYNYNYNHKIQPKPQFQKTPYGFLYSPLKDLPPVQSDGYTLQKNMPYVGQYYFDSKYWLLNW